MAAVASPAASPTASRGAARAKAPGHLRAQTARTLAAPGGRARYYLAYTLLFALFFCACYWFFAWKGKSFIWQYDSLEQQFTNLVYEGRWLRSIVDGSLAAGQLQVPLWDLSFGYGADIPTSLAQILGDPLNLLSAFVAPERAEILFHVLVVVRFYLAGLAFSAYVRHRGHGDFACLAGTLLYTFGGWMSVTFYQSPFAYPMVLFPLLLLGADRIMEGRGPGLFIVSVALFYGTYFYFAYMASLILAPYCVVEFVRRHGGFELGPFVRCLAAFLVLYVVGVALAGLLFFPEALSLLSQSRLSLSRPLDLFYLPSHYTDLVAYFIGIGTISADANFGFGALGLAAVAALLASKGQRVEKGYLLALTLCLVLPVAGRVFNGWGYASDRWTWAYTFLICYLLTAEMERLLAPRGRDLAVFAAFAAAFALYLLVLLPVPSVFDALDCLALLVFLGLMALFRAMGSRRAKQALFLLFLLGDLAFCNAACYRGRIGEQIDIGRAWATITEDVPLTAMGEVDDPGLWRFDSVSVPRSRNASILFDLNSSDLYDSFYNDRVDRLNTLLGLPSSYFNNQMGELGGRSYLESLLAMKYLLVAGDGPVQLPDFYDGPVVEETIWDRPYVVYEDSLALPLAFGFSADEAASQGALEALPIEERPEALLRTLFLAEDEGGADAGVAAGASAAAGTSTVRELPCTMELGDGITLEDGVFHVSSAGATVTLGFDAPAGVEAQVVVEDLDLADPMPSTGEGASLADRLAWARGMLVWRPSSLGFVDVSSPDGPGTRLWVLNNQNHLYAGKHDWVVNLGYSDEPRTEATLTFPIPGDYSYSRLCVAAQPLEALPELVEERRSFDATVEEQLNAYAVSAEVPEGQSGYVLCTIPYSSGWSATVDGEPAEPAIADEAFMAFELGEGSHAIQLSYFTPGLALGLSASGIALAALILLEALGHAGKLGVRSLGQVRRELNR